MMTGNWKMRSYSVLLFALLFIDLSPASFGQINDAAAIEINSAWTGMAPASESKLSIEEKSGQYYRDGKRVNKRLIDSLQQEIEAPIFIPSIENLGITQTWLRSNAESALPERLKKSHQSEKDLFIAAFQDIKLIEKLLPEILGGGWTDDYPNFDLQIKRKDGSSVIVHSSRQNIFMIPFAISENGKTRFSYNANLSRAIASLLPEKFTNLERLSGTDLSHRIAERVMLEIKEKLNWLETRNTIGTELAQLEGRYTLKKTAISGITSVDVGTVDYSTERFFRWNAELHRKDLPDNIIIGVSLPYENNKLTNFNLFLSKIDSMVGLVLSVKWFTKYLSEHPDTTTEIRFVTDRSMSPKAVGYFVKTLKGLKADGLAARVQDQLSESVFVEVSEHGGWSRWVVLPNGKMILFDFQGDKVLKWRLEDFVTQIRYDTKDWHMSKAVISPAGEIETK
jgi:hypothetical protein